MEQTEKEKAARQQAARQQAARQQAERKAAKLEAAKLEAAKQQAEKKQAEKQRAEKQRAAKQEAAKQRAEKQRAAKQEAAKIEAARQAARQAAKQAANKQAARQAVKTERLEIKEAMQENEKQKTIIYVCHDQQSINNCINKDPNAYIFLVGPAEINNDCDKIIIARNLQYNIECERKLLTFTAWYAIIKNNLFPNEKYLCILECDVTIPSLTNYNDMHEDVASFVYLYGGESFLCDINYDVFSNFLKKKNIVYNTITRPWAATTNYIIKRSLLEKFVDFYYPDCIEYIKSHDLNKFSWYHERIFWVFLVENNATMLNIPGAVHLQSGSHQVNLIN